VNATLVSAFLRQRLTSPMRLGLIFLMTVFPLGGVALTGQLSLLAGIAGPVAFILAAGAVGLDLSSGTLTLLFVRPVTRLEYVLSRWLAATLGALGLCVLTYALATLILILRGAPPDGAALVQMVLDAAATTSGYAAIMVMLSTLAGGLGDVGLWVASMIAIQMFTILGQFKQWPWLLRACTEAQHVLSPELSFAWIFQHTPPSWFAIASWASTVTLALALANARMNRRELSYAVD
jgi:ABC-type transport system involved in multi-copper enzyme maturation permease subunit